MRYRVTLVKHQEIEEWWVVEADSIEGATLAAEEGKGQLVDTVPSYVLDLDEVGYSYVKAVVRLPGEAS